MTKFHQIIWLTSKVAKRDRIVLSPFSFYKGLAYSSEMLDSYALKRGFYSYASFIYSFLGLMENKQSNLSKQEIS